MCSSTLAHSRFDIAVEVIRNLTPDKIALHFRGFRTHSTFALMLCAATAMTDKLVGERALFDCERQVKRNERTAHHGWRQFQLNDRHLG